MNDLRRKLCRVLGLLLVALAGLPLTAHASFPATPGALYHQWGNPNLCPSGSAQATFACLQPTAKFCSTYGELSDRVNVAFWTAVNYHLPCSQGGQSTALLGKGQASYCPANSTLNSGNCTCNSGYVENSSHNACVVEPSQKEELCQGLTGQSTGPLTFSGGSSALICDESGYAGSYGGGCAATPQPGSVTVTLPGEAPATAVEGIYTGAVCQGSAPTPPATSGDPAIPPSSAPPATENPCPNGQQGQVNGVNVCVPYPSGATVTGNDEDQREVTNPDGTKSITGTASSTTCTANECTTTKTVTVTTKNAGGTITGVATTTTATTQSQPSFCRENPAAALCKGVEDACTDHPDRIGCLSTGVPSNGVLPTQSVNVGTPGMHSMAGFALSDAPGTGASWETGCPAAMSFTAAGHTFELSFEGICRASEWLRPLVIFISALGALYIVYSALTKK